MNGTVKLLSRNLTILKQKNYLTKIEPKNENFQKKIYEDQKHVLQNTSR